MTQCSSTAGDNSNRNERFSTNQNLVIDYNVFANFSGANKLHQLFSTEFCYIFSNWCTCFLYCKTLSDFSFGTFLVLWPFKRTINPVMYSSSCKEMHFKTCYGRWAILIKPRSCVWVFRMACHSWCYYEHYECTIVAQYLFCTGFDFPEPSNIRCRTRLLCYSLL